MEVFAHSMTSALTAVLIGLLVSIIAFYKWSFTYWKRRGVPEPLKPSIPFGNFSGLFMGCKSFGTSFMDIYHMLKAAKHRFGGAYMLAKPVLVVADPTLIRNIMQVDFQHFVNHGTFANKDKDPLSAHLFNMEDQTWKDWRVKLTPTFTTGKMKMMFETLVNTTHGLRSILTEAMSTKKPINLKDTTARFTTDVIGSVAFGIECNSLKNPGSNFRLYGKRAIEQVTMIDHIKIFLQFVIPRKFLINLRITNKSVEQFFLKVVEDTVQYREKNNISRKDFMHLLLQLRNKGKLSDDESINGDTSDSVPHLSMEEMTAQCFLFFVAGFETSSTTSTFALYELAKNPQIQDKLRHEIITVLEKHNNKLTYECLAEMQYLDQVVNESLRKYPPVPSLFRVCSKDYCVPDSNLVIEEGTQVYIPIWGIQRDPEYYPEPENFDPERFTPENKKERLPFTFMPFGEGPRICIGLRFGIMQAKVLIATTILNCKLKLNGQMKDTLEYQTHGFVTAFKDAIYLDVEQV